MTIDELRSLVATPGKTDDECVLDFYAWQDAREWADCWMDDSDGMEETLYDWFRNGMKPVTIATVVDWLKEFEEEEDATLEDLTNLVKEWRDG